MTLESMSPPKAGAPAFRSVDPATGKVLESYPGTPADEIARKESGYGREMATYGIKEFVNIKTVFVA
jgi:hypothetical protein